MKKSRVIFFSIFAAYHVIVFLFTLFINIKAKHQDYPALFSLLSHLSLFVYGALLGMILLLIDLIWTWVANKKNSDMEDTLHQENNTLKAKIYDLQESKKEAPHLIPPVAK